MDSNELFHRVRGLIKAGLVGLGIAFLIRWVIA